MDWENILNTSAPFVAMFFLITLLVMATCVRKLEEYEERRINPILFDFTDYPEIPSLNEIKTPTTYKSTFFKENMARVLQSISHDTGDSPNSRLTPEGTDIPDDGTFNDDEQLNQSFDYEVYDPNTIEYEETP